MPEDAHLLQVADCDAGTRRRQKTAPPSSTATQNHKGQNKETHQLCCGIALGPAIPRELHSLVGAWGHKIRRLSTTMPNMVRSLLVQGTLIMRSLPLPQEEQQ